MSVSRRSFLQSGVALSAATLFPVRAFAQHFMAPAPVTLSGKTSVPFTISGNHIYITAHINGKPYAFIFDTGGAATLATDVQAELKFPVVGQATIAGAGDGHSTVDIVRVPKASIGSAIYSDGAFVILPAGFPGDSPIAGVRFGGILGREFFGKLVTVLDYEQRTLSFYESKAFIPDPAATAVPLTMRAGVLPNIQASLNGRTGNFDVDAGSAQALTLTEHYVDDNGLRPEFGRTIDVEIGRGLGGYLMGTAARAKTFAMGALTLSQPLVMVAHSRAGVFANKTLSGNIGGQVLRRFTVTLDVPGAKLYLKPNAAFADPFAFNRAGFFSHDEAHVRKVALVVPDSPAAQAGVLVGDTVTAIDGTPAADLTSEQVYEIWVRPAGTNVSLDLQRDGKPMSVAFALRDIL